MEEEKEKKPIEKKYTDSLFYEVFLTGKYIKKMGEQLFKKLEIELTSEEFSTLDFLYETKNICQRDLAVKMLINRANMGKILNGLEKKGYVISKVDTRCNHPVKYASLTEAGEKIYVNTVTKLSEKGKRAIEEISRLEADRIIEGLRKMRNILKEIIDIDI